jgi:hypothetical protein
MKRVPMDFDWPLGRIWKGFLNPYEGCDCPWCYDEGRRSSYGYTKEAQEYEKLWYGQYCGEYVPHPYRPGERYCPSKKPYTLERWEYDFIVSNDRLRKNLFECDPKDVPPFEELTEWLLRHNLSFRIDAIFVSMMCDEYCRRKGVPSSCPHCNGSGKVWQTEEVHRLHEEWERIEPPTGDGYQLWETTSEGSPQSPVFATFEELCEWCAENATTFSHFKATKEEWMKMLDDDFVYHQEGNVIMY